MFGGLLAFLGLASSFFATGIRYLIVSIGVVAGFGFSLTFLSCLTSVGEYFDGKVKLVAISIIGTGAGCGGMLFPFLMDYLIDMYGWRGCVLIVGGLMGNMICFFAVCKPNSVGVSRPKPETCCSQDPDKTQLSSVHQHLHQDTDISNSSDIDLPKEQYTCTEKLNTLKKNVIFIIFVLGIALTLSSFGAALIYMLEFLQTKGFEEQEALLFYFYMNTSAMLCRVLPGLCILVPFIDGLVVSAFFTSLSCLTGVGLLIATTYCHHVILMCVFGIALGCCNTVLSMTTMELVGLDNYAIGIGIVMPVIGVSSIVAGAVSGWLVDVTGSYHTSYYSLSATHGVAVFLFILAIAVRKCCRSQTPYLDERTVFA
ncbi:monocarboxylate transporter 12-like isoform X2 [Mizuhopecten yessoensis]|nr:monocarboxylate transporter 12-like isoform X2 [Mizuhopecten yessoensis]XP_021366824.1 monocarboxylate transporter 12-like isoform X2 [Mizuhopecten yessoensis]XP_021366825.1 monocarboxylate transporter 12-like isoform X2 [Mizuhopecten yessoensis]